MKRDYFPIIPIVVFMALMLLIGSSVFNGGIVNTQPQFAGTFPLDSFKYLVLNLIELPAIIIVMYAIYKIKKENKNKTNA
ncbi:MAG: hypothetical protein ACTSQO_05505 [Candidatus Helarchaeota archaeon]